MCPEREKVDKIEKIMYGMVGDLRMLRDYMVAVRNYVVALPGLRPVQYPPTEQNMHGVQPAPLYTEENVPNYAVFSNVYDVVPGANKDMYTCAGGGGE